ncbi:hypothetical protein [Mesorhizobium sp. M7A.F.Ca.MR.148.00.0.0]|uniref:hypothetical protein n=1 Tax=Mesorhizobium sp. M7A.F.Ca.MR.148.00.0.0 TaxID=2496775 RepID=UPI0013E301C7|nr:hypothetical protein [Mesorhizobium sp. M7A.F.Ca.MR.148.00.0.0]
MIRKLKDGKYWLYSRKKDEKMGKLRNLETFDTLIPARRRRSMSGRCVFQAALRVFGNYLL